MMISAKTRYWLDSRPVADRPSCGDFAECFPVGPDRHAIVLGDVAGRGPAAGMAAGALLAFARSAVTSSKPLRTALQETDEFFTRAVMSHYVPIATLFLAIADTKDGVLEYASAGHEPALYFADPARHDHLLPTGPLLGLAALMPLEFTQRRIQVAADSRLVLVTDGVTEARHYDTNGVRFFGGAGVASAFAKAWRTKGDPARAIADAAAGYGAGQPRDDATAMVVALGVSA